MRGCNGDTGIGGRAARITTSYGASLSARQNVGEVGWGGGTERSVEDEE